jgi:hypothetical protein
MEPSKELYAEERLFPSPESHDCQRKNRAVLRKTEFLDGRTKTREKIQCTKEVRNARSGAC